MATQELDELRKQLETLQRSHDTLLKSLSASNGSFGPSDVPRLRRNATQRGDAVFADTSTLSDDSSDDEDDFFVQNELPSQSFDHEHLREHLRTHNWDEHGREILESLISDPVKLSKQPHLFHLGPGPAEDRSHYSHFQVYNVGPDGHPELVEVSSADNTMSKATEIWHSIRVLQLECFPDWKSTPVNGNPYTFEAGHRYLNGPDAFLHALLTEYRDARKRYDEIYKQITELVTPPLGFLFDEDARRKRLFEDKHFTWTRRYFYAHQALGNVNDSIKAMIDAFEDTFTEDVWDGESKTLWPLYEESPRNDHWKRRLRLLRLQFEREMKELRILQRENNERRHEIETLQEQLFSGTSIQESRKSVELADVTVHQGYNIKVLTIVNLFFMPLTFVTSIFGMTNMPAEPAPYWPFAITLVAICVPFFSIIGFLSTKYGYHVWATKTRQFWRWLRPKPKSEEESETEYTGQTRKNRSMSTEEGIGKALASIIASRASHNLVATARSPNDLAYLPDDSPKILKLQLDVTSPENVNLILDKAVQKFGTVDVLVNSAGYALSGDTESATEAESHGIMETNFFGTVRTTLAALPLMRNGGRGGLVMNISSVAGVCAFPGHAFYHASKHAVEGWTESVAKEMDQDWGISFCIVEPAAVKTNFEGHSKKNTAPHPAYTDPKMPARMLQKYVDAGLKQGVGMEPADVARVLYEVVSGGEKVPLHLPLSVNALGLIKGAFEEKLKELEEFKKISESLS
ncbi:hypothetical protein N0V95_006663 [Ascochyta clinopodiicola]|nr:hypothetical protein N0V95_006663 [Ascochyta clinopodiicola]